MNRTLAVLANEYAVTDSRANNPRAISLGVSPCIGVALMLDDEFNSAAIGHFFVHAQTFGKPRQSLRAYVADGFRRMLGDLNWQPGMKIRAGIVGGKFGYGKERESTLLSKFVHATIAGIPGAEIVFDRSLTGKAEDIVADCVKGDIHVLGEDEISRMLFDYQDTKEWGYGSYNQKFREWRLQNANCDPAGSHFLTHPFSRPAQRLFKLT